MVRKAETLKREYLVLVSKWVYLKLPITPTSTVAVLESTQPTIDTKPNPTFIKPSRLTLRVAPRLTGDLSGQRRLPLVDERVQTLADHILLLLRGSRGEGGSRQRLVRGRSGLRGGSGHGLLLRGALLLLLLLLLGGHVGGSGLLVADTLSVLEVAAARSAGTLKPNNKEEE